MVARGLLPLSWQVALGSLFQSHFAACLPGGHVPFLLPFRLPRAVPRALSRTLPRALIDTQLERERAAAEAARREEEERRRRGGQ